MGTVRTCKMNLVNSTNICKHVVLVINSYLAEKISYNFGNNPNYFYCTY